MTFAFMSRWNPSASTLQRGISPANAHSFFILLDDFSAGPRQGTGWEGLYPADPPSRDVNHTLSGLEVVTSVTTIIYGPTGRGFASRILVAKTFKKYHSQRGTPSPTTKVQPRHWPSVFANLAL